MDRLKILEMYMCSNSIVMLLYTYILFVIIIIRHLIVSFECVLDLWFVLDDAELILYKSTFTFSQKVDFKSTMQQYNGNFIVVVVGFLPIELSYFRQVDGSKY